MKKERSFRPPQSVLEAVAGVAGTPAIVDLHGSAVPLSELRKMHAFLRAETVIAKGDPWLRQGGNQGLMWSRRVLRQEGIIKRSDVGDVFIPEIVDIQLGPTIVVGHADESVDSLVVKFQEAGIPATFVPDGDSAFVFFSGDLSKDYATKPGIVTLPEVTTDAMTILDESRTKLASIMKAANDNITGVRCSILEAPEMPVEASWNSTYLLKSLDYEDQVARILKVDDELGLVLGWAIICTIEGQEYFDKQGDFIPDESMLAAATDFMLNSRVAKEMHVGEEKGTVVFAWPMTAEIAKAFGIETNQTGLMIAMKPDNPEMLEKFRDGTYNGFSIGGRRIETEEVN